MPMVSWTIYAEEIPMRNKNIKPSAEGVYRMVLEV